MLFYASELKESEKHMRNLAHMPVKGRIVEDLFALQKKFGRDREGYINVAISRQDLASYAGTTYETSFRMLNELERDHLIKLEKKNKDFKSRQISVAAELLAMTNHMNQNFFSSIT
jgi:CRP/FNR family transcriptional regulator